MLVKTIAILGDPAAYSRELLKVLAKQKLRLLFVSRDEGKDFELKKQFEQLETTAELDFISCEKEGCWEADVIILYKPVVFSSAVIEKIRVVATQKSVLVISENNKQKDTVDFKELLPHSKVIEIEPKKLQDALFAAIHFETGKEEVFETFKYQ